MGAPDDAHPYRRPSPPDDDDAPPRSGSMRAVTFFGGVLIAAIGAATLIPILQHARTGSALEEAAIALGPWLDETRTVELLRREDPRAHPMLMLERPSSGFESDARGHIESLERGSAGVAGDARGVVVRVGRTLALDAAHVALTDGHAATRGDEIAWIATVRRSRERGAYHYAAASVDVERVLVHVVDPHGETIGRATIEALPPPHTGVPPAYTPLDDGAIASAIERLVGR